MTDDGADWFAEHDGRFDKKLMHLRGLLSDAGMFDEDDAGPALGGAPLERARGFRIQGIVEDEAYEVGVFWGGELGEQVAVRGWPRDREATLTALRAREGESVPVGSTGETVALHLNNPLAILAALVAFGEVHSVAGDQPLGWL